VSTRRISAQKNNTISLWATLCRLLSKWNLKIIRYLRWLAAVAILRLTRTWWPKK